MAAAANSLPLTRRFSIPVADSPENTTLRTTKAGVDPLVRYIRIASFFFNLTLVLQGITTQLHTTLQKTRKF